MQVLKSFWIYILAPLIAGTGAALLGTYLLTKAPEAPRPTPITFTYQEMNVPKVGSTVTMPIMIGNDIDKYEAAQNYIDFFKYGFFITEYRIENTGEKLIKGVELKPDSADILISDTGRAPDPAAAIITDIPPKTFKTFVAIQKYPSYDWSATVGTDYFPAVKALDAAQKKGKSDAEQYLFERNFVISTAMAPFYLLVLLLLAFVSWIFGAYAHNRGWITFS
ncbi:hypothetical protein, partial [Agrobacterium tumefaciens]|uniref:hypothetical protein n=1 Tax=Agrobacterium tumefaciens TaxID=358 RepID=UPI002AFF7559